MGNYHEESLLIIIISLSRCWQRSQIPLTLSLWLHAYYLALESARIPATPIVVVVSMVDSGYMILN